MSKLLFHKPLVLKRRFPSWTMARPEVAFAWLHRAHWLLLVLGVITIVGAVAGSQGWSIF